LQLALTDLDRVPSSASKAVHWEAGLQRAQIYHDQKNFLQSQEVLSLILNQPLNPKLKSKALFLQATNFRSLNQPGNSLKSFQESMHLDPSPSPDTALEILIDSFKSDLSQEWRIQFIESALQKLGFVPALFDSLLSIYQAQNAPTLALALIQKWENEFPNPLFLNLEKAILLTQLNEKPKAKEVLNSLILKIEKLPPETKSKQSFQTLLAQAHAQKEQL